MIELRKKKIWQSTEIIDLPYKPFEESDKTERAVLNHIANGIIKISKNESRKGRQYEANKKYNFSDSECIVGIDVSNIGDAERSYLDTLFLVTKLHPFVLLNCNIKRENLLQLNLHRELKDRGYILPIFSRITPNDILFAAKRYGTLLVELLSGERNELDITDLKNLDKTYLSKNLTTRFPGLNINDNNVTFSPEVVWLGVDSLEISKGLNALFNSNSSEFDISIFCSDYNIDRNLLELYLSRSMLFGKGKNNNIMFRLLRKNVFIDLMRALVSQFESAMIDRGAIDTTHSDFAGFHRFLEYHSIGNVFQMKDTFAFKLLSYVRQSVSSCKFDTIVVADNGKEKSLFDLISKIFPDVNTVRIMNYFENPIIYPFDVLESERRILVLVDIVNTGDFLERLLKYVRETKLCTVTGIFTFILNPSVNINKFFPLEEHKEAGNFLYFLDKSLDDVKDIRNDEQSMHFNNADEEAFLRFWNMINNFGSVSIEFVSGGARVTQTFGHSTNVRVYYSQKVEFSENAERLVTAHSHLYLSCQKLLKRLPFSAVVIRNDETSKRFANLVKKIDSKLDIFVLDDKLGNNLSRLAEHRGILVFSNAINIGQHTYDLVMQIKRASAKETKIAVFTLFSRKNVIEENSYLSAEFSRELMQLDVDYFSYYESNLPYYLVKSEPREFKQVESLVKEITSSWT